MIDLLDFLLLLLLIAASLGALATPFIFYAIVTAETSQTDPVRWQVVPANQKAGTGELFPIKQAPLPKVHTEPFQPRKKDADGMEYIDAEEIERVKQRIANLQPVRTEDITFEIID